MIHLISEMTLTVHFSCDDLGCSLCLLILYRKSRSYCRTESKTIFENFIITLYLPNTKNVNSGINCFELFTDREKAYLHNAYGK